MRLAGVVLLAAIAPIAAGHPARADQPAAPANPHLEPRAEPAPPDHGWLDGDHLTGDWGGARSALSDAGVTIDLVYASDLYTARGAATALGHIDAALTLDTQKLGLWSGGTFYVLVQNNHGDQINAHVGSDQPVTNLEADPYTQLSELFLEQTAFDERLRIRVGKQDANRDFGTPRFGGNFINNNFGMYPTSPLPSYPTTGLGILVAARPLDWLTAKAAVYEGSPETGGLGLTTAFHSGAGYIAVASASVTHRFGPGGRDGGITSLGVWRQSDDIAELGVAMPRTFDSDTGWFFQHDERIYLHPTDPDDPRGLTLIARVSGAQADRTAVSRYAGASAAWHGVGPRHNDTTGIGFGYLRVTEPVNGSPGPADEWFAEAFYKLRLTNFLSFQPDLQWFRHPGGDGPDAFVAGIRLKLKL